ncbi:MAG TPA: MOSC domain-containing protein [Gemmataceae bacterium]|nr:MOSC domain-containing protein [Gemmataceae bacterium]
MPHIVSITYTPAGVERKPADYYARVPVDRAALVEGQGIEGDLKGGRGRRQLNVMFAEALAGLAAEGRQVGPGQMGEQLVIAGLDPAAFAEGSRLRLGPTAVIEVTLPRTGCERFEHIQGVPKELVAGRLGVMARVVAGGEVALGDEVVPA